MTNNRDQTTNFDIGGISSNPESRNVEPRNKRGTRAKNHILVVDDDPISSYVLEEILQSEGYEVYLSKSPEEVHEFLNGTNIDFIVLDLYMPGKAGWEILSEIRQEWPATELPICIVSAENNPAIRGAFLLLGANDFLSKPIDRLALLASIQRWIGPRPHNPTHNAPMTLERKR